METAADKLYSKYYGGDRARRGVFDAIAAWHRPAHVLYPGGFIHVTASFVFPSVVYVDTDRQAKRFFSKPSDVIALVDAHKAYAQAPELAFHPCDYQSEFDEPAGSFDLLLSLYAGFISQACKRYLAPGGLLVANNSHGDAGLASIDPDYEFVAVLAGRGDRLWVKESGLDAYFKPKKDIAVTEPLLRELGRGVAYTKTAPAYVFRRRA